MSGADWVGLTRETPYDPARRIIDAHHHLWGEGEGPGGMPAYLHEALIADIAGHNVVGTVYVECGAGYRKGGREALRPVGETESVAAVARRARSTRSPLAGIVAHADLTLGDAVQEVLDAHAEAGEGLFRGVRQLPIDPARSFHDSVFEFFGRNLLAEPAFREGAARLGRNGYSFDVFVLMTQLPEVAALARAVPDTVLILNHLGMPMYGGAVRDEVQAVWRDGMRQAASCPNVYLKLGGVGMDDMFGMGWSTLPRPPGSDAVAAWWGDDIRWCIDAFGPSRCMFESNYPVDRSSVGYTVLWNAFQKIAAAFSDEEQDALLAGAAARAYRIS
jgi:predicted TIM-barrel fold metal-dependent hydrolase